jgi:hypothetical protein
MDGGADPADTLHEKPCIARVTAFQDGLQATVHLTGRPCLGNLPFIHFDIYPEVTLDPGYRINGDSLSHV